MFRPAALPLALALFAIVAGAAEIDPAVAEVERIRGLAFEKAVEVVVLPRADLRKTLEAQIAKETTIPIPDYLDVLAALGFIDRTEGALDALMDVYESQVLAFYDPSSGKYTTFDEAPGGMEMVALLGDAIAVHELTHALQDQRFGAGARLRGLEKEWDAQIAYHAVLEGEATLVMLASLMNRLDVTLDQIVSNDEVLGSMEQMAALNPGMPTDAPPYFVESLKFPYLRGLAFVVEAYRRGGWKGVDRLHRHPPRSSEEILRPELYFERRGEASPAQCGSSGAVLATTLGEFHWSFLLGEEAAAGWDADCVRVTRADGGMRVDGSSVWETEKDASEFAEALRAVLGARAEQKGRRVDFRWNGGEVAAPAAP